MKMDRNKIDYLKYSNEELQTSEHSNLDEINIEDESINWINITSLEYRDLIDSLIEKYDIGQRIIEDIKDLDVRSTLETYKDYKFMVMEEVKLDETMRLKRKQISLIIFKDLIISITEKDTDLFQPVLKRIEEKVNVVDISVDNIFYEITDETVQSYFDVLETLGDKIDDVEDELLLSPDNEALHKVYIFKRDLIKLRTTLWLMRNAIHRLIDDKSHYFREIYDDLMQLIDLTETYRETCSGMLNIYLSGISKKTNEVMKFLTIFSSIFIPITFMAGVYGMNFKFLPEIGWKYGYIGFWIISIALVGFMIRFFKKKDWM